MFADIFLHFLITHICNLSVSVIASYIDNTVVSAWCEGLEAVTVVEQP